MKDFASGEIMEEMVTSLVWEYLYQNSYLVVSDLERIGTVADNAIKTKMAILFDTKFYYFSPELLFKICEPLLQTFSETEFKRQLRAEQIIYCNSADYTVKKTVTNVYGIPDRPRFIWVYKEKLLSPDNLLLEDVFIREEEM